MEDCVAGSSKSLHLKRGRTLSSVGLGLEDRTLGRRYFPNQTPGETTQQLDGSKDPLDAGAMYATYIRNADSHSKDYWQQAT